MALRVRSLTDEEREELRRRAQSRTAPARAVERARMVLAVHGGESAPVVARRPGVGADAVRQWIKRFDTEGLAGLEDRPRSGRPLTYTAEQVGQVLATAATTPERLGSPFGCWTPDRLTAYLHERPPGAGGPLPISRSHLDRLLSGEGLRWRKEETWFGERVDPQFAEKSPDAPAGSTGDENGLRVGHTAVRQRSRHGRGRPVVLRARKKSGRGAARKHRLSPSMGEHAEQTL